MRIALALIACAGLGFAAGKADKNAATSQQVVACAPAPATAIVDAGPVVEQPQTPLVEKLLPKEDYGPVIPIGPPKKVGPSDGQRTADNFFEYDATRNIWAPVDHGHTRYTENGHAPTAEHLIREHGHARSSASKWTQAELEIAHANSHWWEKTHSQKISFQPKTVSQMSSSCPNGQCGSPSRSRGIFRRR